MQQKHKT